MSKKEETREVLMIRLFTGEEILAGVTDKGDDYELFQPILAHFVKQPGQPQPQVALMPLLSMSQDTTVTLSKSHVLYSYTPVEQLVKQHTELFTESSIITPNKNIIVPK